MDENQVWDIRAFVYRHFAETTRAPSVEETASYFGLTHKEATSAYQALAQRHALFLKPGTDEIFMAWPFSSVETPFKVHANGKTYFANCAWDSFGIPVALHVDAEIDAVCAQSGENIHLTVRNQEARAARSRSVRADDVLVHLLTPFKDWYTDLPFT